MAPSTLVARSYSNEAGVCTTSLLSLPVGAVSRVGRVAIDLARHGGRVLQVGLSSLRRLCPPVGGRVGLVAGAWLDAALSRRLVGFGRLPEDRAAELTILRQHLARPLGSSELGGQGCPRRGFRPTAPSRGPRPHPVWSRRAAHSAGTGRAHRCRSPATAAAFRGVTGASRDRGSAHRGCRPPRCAAPGRGGSRSRSAPLARAGPA